MTLAVMDVALDELDEDRSVAEALEGTVAAENAIEQELQALMEILVVSARDRVGWLEVLSRSTVGIKSHVSELQGTVSVAARKAEKVASRVRVLDASFQRCETALQRVEDVLALRTCAEGVRNALEHSDLETACGHVAKYLSLDEAARAEFNAESGAFASVSQVNESIADLTRAIRERADRAAEKDSVQEVANAVKLFVPIGLAEEGLERFAEYLKGVVHRESQEDVNALLLEQTETVEEEPHVMCLTRLFETVAGYLDASEDAIVESFGSLAFIRVVENLQQQCDSEAISILSRYTQERRLDEYSRLIGHRSVEARTLVPLLDEQAVISQRTMRYFAFLTNCAQTTLQQEKDAQIVSTSSMVSATGLAEDAEGEGRTPRPMNSNTMRTPKEEKTEPSAFDLVQHEFAVSLRECGLQKAVEELTTRYISMEAYFMQENVLKAIRIDEAPPLGSNEKTSTAVDEVFYFLEYSVRRAVTYANVVTLCAVINYANLAISTELLDFVKRRLRETHPALDKLSSYASGTPLKGLMLAEKSTKHGEEFRSPYGFTVALNNAQVSSDYSLRLRGQVEKSANEAFTTPRDHAQINAVLAQLSESSRSLAASAEASLTSLGTALTSRLRDAVSSLILLRPDLRADPPFFPPTTVGETESPESCFFPSHFSYTAYS